MNTTTETQLQFDFTNPEQLTLHWCSAPIGTMATLDSSKDLSMTFYDGKNVIGKLDWNDGTMKFSGSVDESAQLFFDCIIQAHTQDTLFEQKKNNTEMKS
jgi:hypothetical protein